jgi:hypothetical protein
VTDVDLALRHLRGEHRNERVEGCVACGTLPAVSTADPEPARENPARPSSTPTGRKCGCGCGAAVRNRFLPGHDAKLKSRLVKEARAGDEAALQKLREHGWEHFA